MKILPLIGLMTTVFLIPAGANASSDLTHHAVQVGDTYELSRTKESSTRETDGSSGTTHDRDTIIERIAAIRPDGLELVFDLPNETTADERRQNWQFPARVFQPREGRLQLLNAAELGNRIDAWLKWGKMSREACGHWIFTWNAFKIECDPQSVIETIQAFEPALHDLRAGAPYVDAHALAPAPLTQKDNVIGESIFTAHLTVDPKVVQRDRAQSDVVVGEIMRKPVSFDAALANRAKEEVSGTIEVTIDAAVDGGLRRLTKVTSTQTKMPSGNVQTEVATVTIERRRISSTTRSR